MVKYYINSTTSFFYSILFILMLTASSTLGQCAFGNDVGGFDPQNNFDWAQTFTAECDGFLEYVEFITGSGGTQQARSLEIFEGATVSGTPVYTQDFSQMTFNAAGESLRIVLGEEFPIENGDVFTFQIPGVTVNLLVNVATNGNPDVYPEGFAWENGSSFNELVDFVFNVSITDALATDDFDVSAITHFPSPANDLLNISLGRAYDDIQISMYSVTGTLIQNDSVQRSDLALIDISRLSNGIYFAVITTESGEATIRFVKS